MGYKRRRCEVGVFEATCIMSSSSTKRITRSMSTRAAKRRCIHKELANAGVEATPFAVQTIFQIPELLDKLPPSSLVKLRATSSDMRSVLSTKSVGIRIWAAWFNAKYDTELLPNDCAALTQYFPTEWRPYTLKWIKSIPNAVVSAEFVRLVSCRGMHDDQWVSKCQTCVEAKHVPTARWILIHRRLNVSLQSQSLTILLDECKRTDSESLIKFIIDNGTRLMQSRYPKVRVQLCEWLKTMESTHVDARYKLYECYRYGYGTGVDITRALNLLAECAMQRHTLSIGRLFDILNSGSIENVPGAVSVVNWVLTIEPEADREFLLANCKKLALGVPRNSTITSIYHLAVIKAYLQGSHMARVFILSRRQFSFHAWDRAQSWGADIPLDAIVAAGNDPQVRDALTGLLRTSIEAHGNGRIIWPVYQRYMQCIQ
ncbi:uncharacterized protein BJ171DRAFT_535823 [Polychytrium aggregatum]|uniref:uncharacterized protein n=1 Tax=Polychytrium aggregatum TaxID=110093 RepID=UPI0022FE5991|nr:uncharacterized protein BJ171DRAFT_535823 [Polychytrium aggregatum]KAI9193015.1 hypothetical protein BJ171DRAFT_535823 [Polychytrium aggregatum]